MAVTNAIHHQEVWGQRVFAFVKPILLVLTKPRAFFDAYYYHPERLDGMPFPGSGALPRVVSTPTVIMSPMRCLGTALGILGFVLLLQGLMVELVLPHDLVEAIRGSDRRAELFFERSTGHRLVKIDTQNLTGFAPIDAPIGEYVQLFRYLYFAAFFGLFISRPPSWRNVIDYFAYALSASVTLVSAAGVVAIVVFVFLAFSPDAAFAFSGLVQLLGEVPKLFYCLVLPIMIFPALFDITKRSVARATFLAVLAWIATNLLFTQFLLMGQGIMVVW